MDDTEAFLAYILDHDNEDGECEGQDRHGHRGQGAPDGATWVDRENGFGQAPYQVSRWSLRGRALGALGKDYKLEY